MTTHEIPVELSPPVADEKFIVFKRNEWEAWADEAGHRSYPEDLADAVVIRTRDAFAGPALHSYAASIGVAARVISKAGRMGLAKDMLAIGDYFHARACEADEYAQLDADHIPD